MKKYIITFVIALLIIPSTVSATSGACSYHSGVNCSAGASVTGNAICNDGSISSVSYYSMSECQLTTVYDFCSPAYASQQMTAYTTAPSDAIRSVIKSTINADIQLENQTLNRLQQELNSSVQYDTSMWNTTIQRAQQDQQSAISSAQQSLAALNSSGGISSDNQGFLSSAGSQFNSVIQNDQQNENLAIQQTNAQYQPSINSANQCVNSLNQLSNSLNSYQPPAVIIPPQTVPTLQATTSSTNGNNTCHVFSNHLQLGSIGHDVIVLQSWLVSKNFLIMPAGVSLGSFGGLTKAAVVTYQASIGLPPTGYVGNMTISKLNTSCVTQ
jgi:hypothetical protein